MVIGFIAQNTICSRKILKLQWLFHKLHSTNSRHVCTYFNAFHMVNLNIVTNFQNCEFFEHFAKLLTCRVLTPAAWSVLTDWPVRSYLQIAYLKKPVFRICQWEHENGAKRWPIKIVPSIHSQGFDPSLLSSYVIEMSLVQTCQCKRILLRAVGTFWNSEVYISDCFR